MYNLFVVSDGSGRSARQMLDAALMQFSRTSDVKIHVRADILDEKQILAVLQEAVQEKGVIFHTIVPQELRKLLIRQSKLQGIESVDLMGPILSSLSQLFSTRPSENPGLFHQLNQAYFKRIESMEFAFRHDDGQRVHELDVAEIILVGVSRTFKTPLSIYLALKGWFVANVPLILNIQPPAELLTADPKKVIALTARPLNLAELRKSRDEHLGNSTGRYAKLDYIKEELNYAMRLFAHHPDWRRISVTNKPIEEIASDIIGLFSKARLHEE